jgi:glutaredoxin
MENQKRIVEIFSAGCSCCEDVISAIKAATCPSCDITIHDMRQAEVAERAKQLGVRSVPAVAIDGKLAGCCSGRGPDLDTLRAEGLGVPLM